LHLGHDFTYHKLTRVFGRWYILVLARRKMREKNLALVGLDSYFGCVLLFTLQTTSQRWNSVLSAPQTRQAATLLRRVGGLHKNRVLQRASNSSGQTSTNKKKVSISCVEHIVGNSTCSIYQVKCLTNIICNIHDTKSFNFVSCRIWLSTNEVLRSKAYIQHRFRRD